MDGKRTQVLLVEDEEAHAELIRRAFRADGSRVELTVANTLQEARRIIAASVPDLVIAEIRLPDGNGLDILPADGGEIAFPVVVLTAHGDEDVAVESMKRGALDYMVKSEATLADAPRIAQRALREWRHITERKRTEEALHDSETRYRTLVETAQEGIGIVDAAETIVFANQAYADLLGYEKEKLVGLNLRELTTETEFARYRKETQKKQGGISSRYDTVMRCKTGEFRYFRVSTSPLHDDQGAFIGTMALLTDVTERRRAEEALEKARDELEQKVKERTAELVAANRQLWDEVAVRKQAEEALRVSEEWFRLAFEEGPLGMAIFSPDRRFLDANRALCDMLGYTCEELLGQEIASVTHPGDRQTCMGVSQQVFDGEIPSGTWEARYLDKHGHIVWGRVTTSVIRNRKGQTMYGLAMVENVTQRKLAEERMEKLRTQLAHLGRVATMGEMASGIAHEINQPLGVIVTRAEVGARRIELGKNDGKTRQRELLQFIADQAYRAGEIIRRMRNFMKRSEPRRTTVHMAELIGEVLLLAGNDLQQARIAVTCNLDHSLPPILADKIQVQQVLLNLIRNSLEAMEGTPPTARKLNMRATRRGGLLEVAVSDTGCGIPHGGVDSLFEAFQGSKPDGMGMGLAISRSIVEAHGGRIWAASNPDAGATFAFTLPITEEDP